jgi:quercetin dioxygenase-like cupin family protein
VFGTGLVCWEGLESAVVLGVGDWWHVQPGVAHWHGATASSPFAHLAVTAGGRTHWRDEVTEDEYKLRRPEPPPQ